MRNTVPRSNRQVPLVQFPSANEPIETPSDAWFIEIARAARITAIFSMPKLTTFQMMFVSGETGDVSPETTTMIENIVQQQVMEMVYMARHRIYAFAHAGPSSSARQISLAEEESEPSAQMI